MATNSGATTAGTGSATLNPYIKVGPLNQSYGYGFGTSGWGGSSGVLGTLNGALLNDTAGTGGVGTSITLASTTGFPTSGVIKVDSELISYTGISSNDLTGISRAANGTSTAAHSNGAGVEYFIGWGDAALSSTAVSYTHLTLPTSDLV